MALDQSKHRPYKSAYLPVPPGEYGWFCGGSSTDRVDRIVLTNDTANAVDRCNLSVNQSPIAGFADASYGWIGCSAAVNRITLADDTTNALDRCDISLVRSQFPGFSDTIHGWFCGGEIPAADATDVVDRITIADDTTNAIDRCDLMSKRRAPFGITNDTYGWIGGGHWYTGGMHHRLISIERIVLANDTVNGVSRCGLTVGRERLAGITNNVYGWFAGGVSGGATWTNIIDRMTIASDTVNAIDRCNLSLPRYGVAGISDATHGWFGGGNWLYAAQNIVDRITLANDTVNAVDRCNLTSNRDTLTGFTGTV